jgi:hypothetical protein
MKLPTIFLVLLPILTGCAPQGNGVQVESDAELARRMVGEWSWSFDTFGGHGQGTIVVGPNGHYLCQITLFGSNDVRQVEWEGTQRLTNGTLIDTIIRDSQTNAPPVPRISRAQIIRLDADELVLRHDNGQTMTFVRKGVESKPPQSSAALEKAKKIKLSTVKFDSLPLAVVITMLQDESVKCDAARKGVTISLGQDAKQLADAEINLDLGGVTLAEALERVADSIGLEMQATDAELLLVRKKAKQ